MLEFRYVRLDDEIHLQHHVDTPYLCTAWLHEPNSVAQFIWTNQDSSHSFFFFPGVSFLHFYLLPWLLKICIKCALHIQQLMKEDIGSLTAHPEISETWKEAGRRFLAWLLTGINCSHILQMDKKSPVFLCSCCRRAQTHTHMHEQAYFMKQVMLRQATLSQRSS